MTKPNHTCGAIPAMIRGIFGFVYLSALTSSVHAGITGSWHFTGARFEGSNSGNPQITRTTGTAVISQSGANFTVSFQFPGTSPAVTVPLTTVGSDYRAEVQVDSPPYDILRSVVVRDHGSDTLTINWVDASYEQESPYGGFPDMQKFSAISGALTKAAAPVADPDAWEGLWIYDGHLFEAGDAGEGFYENFIEIFDIVRDGPDTFTSLFPDDGGSSLLDLINGELRWGDSYPGGQINYEDDFYLVEETGEMSQLTSIQLGGGRAVAIWFGQGTHQLTIKDSTSGPGSGPYPSLQYAYAEVGLMTLPAGPPGPDTPPADAVTDTDSDGVTDLLEYAFNLNPAVSDRRTLTEGSGSSGLPAMRLDTTTTPARLRIEYVRRKNPSAAGIDYQVQWSSNLSSWSTGASSTVVTSIDEIWERVVVTDPSPGLKRFARLSVSLAGNTAAELALIPAGAFTMGRTSGDTDTDAPPVTVTVSAFYMGKYEVTKAEWDEVRTWAVANGYTDLAAGAGKAANHPVQTVSWWDVIKWCNARSEKEGLTPCYTVSGAVMKTGATAPAVNWSANGYRLPTEAEWEKAARGGVSGKRFPWGTDTISHSQENFFNGGGEAYQTGTTGFHPTYATGSTPYTSPVGSFAANGYGLNDMAGNVFEWCWDWYGDSTYVDGATDPRGAASGSDRVLRGGGWNDFARYCRVADRDGDYPSFQFYGIGFRIARSSVP